MQPECITGYPSEEEEACGKDDVLNTKDQMEDLSEWSDFVLKAAIWEPENTKVSQCIVVYSLCMARRWEAYVSRVLTVLFLVTGVALAAFALPHSAKGAQHQCTGGKQQHRH